jgi:hypothetical protein
MRKHVRRFASRRLPLSNRGPCPTGQLLLLLTVVCLLVSLLQMSRSGPLVQNSSKPESGPLQGGPVTTTNAQSPNKNPASLSGPIPHNSVIIESKPLQGYPDLTEAPTITSWMPSPRRWHPGDNYLTYHLLLNTRRSYLLGVLGHPGLYKPTSKGINSSAFRSELETLPHHLTVLTLNTTVSLVPLWMSTDETLGALALTLANCQAGAARQAAGTQYLMHDGHRVGIILSAKAGTGCVYLPLKTRKPDVWIEFDERRVRGAPWNLCIWDSAAQLCDATQTWQTPEGNGWTRVVILAGIRSPAFLYFYADAAGSLATVVQYAHLLIESFAEPPAPIILGVPR